MRVAIEMQQLGPDIASAVILAWLKGVGDSVQVGDPLVELETEKADVEMEALEKGTLAEIVHGPGVEVQVGDIIGYLEVAAK